MRNTTSMDFDSYLMFQTFPALGTSHGTKTDEFLEKCQRGGGSFSIQKFKLQILEL